MSTTPHGPADRLRELARLLPEGVITCLDRAALERLAGSLSDEVGLSDTEPDLTVAEAAERLRLSANRVRALIGAGKLAAYRIGAVGHLRITADALRRFRAAGTPPAQSRTEGPAARVDLGRWRRARRNGGG